MKKIFFALGWALLGCVPAAAFQLSGFEMPESAVRDTETGAVFISNINGDIAARDGNGYISRISASGTVVIQKFIGGKPGAFTLDAPKGLAVWGDKLIVSDIDRVHLFNKRTGAALKTLLFSGVGATFLNDLTVDSNGMLYASDTLANTIFIVDLKKEEAPRVYKRGMGLGGPNGLAVNPRSGNLIVVTWVTGAVLEIDRSGRIHILKRGLKSLDGVDFDDQWNLYVSSFTEGEIYRIPYLGRGTISIFTSGLRTPADLSFDRRKREILVPLMEGGVVESFKN